MTQDVDVFISGGGIAGLTAAAAFGARGYRVVCADPVPPATAQADEGADLRSTAFLQPARNTLADAGLWDQLAAYATPLQTMLLADAGGEQNEIRVVADFDASEISEEPFGWNLPNWLLRREMLARLEALETVQFLPGVATKRLTTRDDHALALLSDGTTIRAQLVLGADGRNSFVREAMGIDVKTTRYGQKALVFTVSHTQPHDHVSIEIHRTGGPFTLVPLPDHGGAHHSSVVWMDHAAEAQALMDMDEAAFTDALNERACNVFGPLTLTGPRKIWPIISQEAAQLTGQRTALIAEAAHVMPPIGAQGLNMSLADIQTLLDLAKDGIPLGSPSMLADYEKRRKPDITRRIKGVDMLNRAAMANSQSLRDLRVQGLKLLHGVAPVRKTLMKTGLGL